MSPGGAKQLAGRVDVRQGASRIGRFCYPYHLADPNGSPEDMLVPWEAFKSREKREAEMELLGPIETTP